MPHNYKRRSIFKIILKKIFITIIVLNFILSGMIMREIMLMQETMINAKKESVKKEVIGLVEFMNTTLVSVENVFSIIQQQVFDDLLAVNKKSDLRTYDLNLLHEKHNLDTAMHNIWIIENDIYVNSTIKEDIGFNVKGDGHDNTVFLNKVLNTNEIIQERIDFEPFTSRLKSYSYVSTPDKKYIIKLGSYSEVSDAMLQMFSNRLQNVISDNPEVVSANVWLADNKSIGLLKEGMQFTFHDSLFNSAVESKSDVQLSLCKHNLKMANYMYLDLPDAKYVKSLVVSLVTDMNNYNDEMGTIIKKQISFTIMMLLFMVVIIMATTRDFRFMLRDLVTKTSSIAEGNLHERVIVKGNNEFTTLAEQFNLMVEKLEKSYNDINSKSQFIAESNEELKQQNEEISAQRDEIEAQRNLAIDQKSIIEKQKEEMVDSINYAQRIQEATLPHEFYINEILPENFIIFKPRDIVSGDFYWIRQINEHIIVAAVDCTGHGVPGAIMSILGISLLNEIIQHKQITQPNLVLNELRKQVKRSLRQSGKARETRDGMDVALCSINTKNNTLEFAGAFNPLLVIRNNEIIEIKGDRMPVGIYIKEKSSFTNHVHKLETGDSIYLFSDGFADQVGGADDKKFKIANLKQLLLENNAYSMFEQKEIIQSTLEKWMHGHQQIDDIMLLGFRYS